MDHPHESSHSTPPSRRFRPLRLATALLALGGASSCGGDGGTTPEPEPVPQVASVSVDPGSFAIQFGDTLRLTAAVRDGSGQLMTGQTVTWSSSDEAVATVSSSGLVVGRKGGSATITASVAGRSAGVTGTVTPFRIADGVVVIDSLVLDLVSSPEERAAGTYRFQFVGSGTPPSVQAGDVVVGAQGLGFLRLVRSVAASGGDLTLETDAATLGDMIEAGEFAFDLDLFEGGALGSAPVRSRPGGLEVRYGPVVPLRPVPAGLAVTGLGIDFSGFDICEFFEKNDPSNACPSIIDEFKIPHGRFDFSPSFDFGTTWDDGDLTEFHGIASGTLSSDLAVALGAKLSASVTREATLLEVGRIIYLQVGAIPVVVHLELEIKAKFEASATLKGRLEGGVETSHTVDVGARWDAANGWVGVLDASGNFTAKQPSIDDGTAVVSITLDGKITLTPQVNLKFYGVAGPLLGAGPWAKANMTASTTTCGFDSSAGLDGEVGIALADFVSKALGNPDFTASQTLATLQGTTWQCPVGDVRVTTATTGDEIDADGYGIEIDGQPRGAIGTAGESFFGNVRLGERAVALTGVADNCSVVGDNPRVVDVKVGSTSRVDFRVECQGTGVTTGAIEITVRSSGLPADPDGYRAEVDGNSKAVGLDDLVTFAGLAAGPHSVELSDLEANCTVQGSNPIQVTVVANNTQAVSFQVRCSGGELAITTATTGPFPTDAQLGVTIDGDPYRDIGPDETLRLDRVDGTYSVLLTGVPTECTLSGSNPASVEVPDGGVGTAVFALTCQGSDLTVDVVTVGDNGGQPTYRLEIDGALTQTVTADGGSATFSGLAHGPHTLEILDVPEKCVVDGQNPRSVTVPGTLTVTVNCTGITGEILFRRIDPRTGAKSYEIHTMNSDGTDPTLLSGRGILPRWRPGGDAYAAFQMVGNCDRELGIRMHPLAGGTFTQVLTDPCQGKDYVWYSWDRSGNQMVVQTEGASVDGTFELLNVVSGSITTIFDPGGEGIYGPENPDWSPVDDRILFDAYNDDGNAIYLMNASGGGAPSPVITFETYDVFKPIWSNDGTRVAYFRSLRDQSVANRWQAVVSKLDGSELVVLASDLAVNFFWDRDTRLSWSPDDSRVLISATRSDPGTGAWIPTILLADSDGAGSPVVVREYAGGAEWRRPEG